MAGRSVDGQPPCKKRMENMTAARLLDISKEMETKARDDLRKLEMDMHQANILHMGMVDRLEQLGDKLRKTNDAAEKLQIKIRCTANEIEKSKNEQNEMLAVRRKLEKQTTYYEFCRRLLDSDPENSSLWYFTGTECPICLEKYEDMVKLNYCQHLLCFKCLTSLFETSHSCPLCRSQIIGYDTFDRKFLRTEYVTISQHLSRTSNFTSSS